MFYDRIEIFAGRIKSVRLFRTYERTYELPISAIKGYKLPDFGRYGEQTLLLIPKDPEAKIIKINHLFKRRVDLLVYLMASGLMDLNAVINAVRKP